MSGLFRLVSTKSNGIIVTNLEDGKSTFISSRLHHVSPLENIGIYRDNDESTPLRDVLMKMEETEGTNAIPASTETHDKLKAYLKNILPDFDQERVHYSDLKKLVKWYSILKEKNMLPKKEDEAKAEEKAEDVKEEVTAEEGTEEKKPKKKATKKK